MSGAERARAAAAAQVAEFMRKRGLKLNDLIGYGAEDFKDPKRGEKARRVSACWELIARLGVKYADIEHSERVAQPTPGLTA